MPAVNILFFLILSYTIEQIFTDFLKDVFVLLKYVNKGWFFCICERPRYNPLQLIKSKFYFRIVIHILKLHIFNTDFIWNIASEVLISTFIFTSSSKCYDFPLNVLLHVVQYCYSHRQGEHVW